MPLEGPDKLHLRAAAGYVELEMFEEANAELEEIDPFCRHLPEVLMARLAIYHGLKKWDLMAIVAKKLAEWNPKEPAFSLNLPMQPDALNPFTPPTRSLREPPCGTQPMARFSSILHATKRRWGTSNGRNSA